MKKNPWVSIWYDGDAESTYAMNVPNGIIVRYEDYSTEHAQQVMVFIPDAYLNEMGMMVDRGRPR